MISYAADREGDKYGMEGTPLKGLVVFWILNSLLVVKQI